MAEKYYSLTDIVRLTDNLVAAMPSTYYNGIMAVRSEIAGLEPADVAEVKRGRWELITMDDGYGEYQLYKCDQCGDLAARRRNYCPECGAKMKEEN